MPFTEPFGGARGSGTNDKAGSPSFFTRWANPRSIKEVRLPVFTGLFSSSRLTTLPSASCRPLSRPPTLPTRPTSPESEPLSLPARPPCTL